MSMVEIKRDRSERQRIQCLLDKRNLQRSRQSIISQSLKNIDTANASKRIVFQSDDEDTAEASNAGTQELFAEEDDNDHSEFDFESKIKNRHHGKKGARLMAIEAQYGNDARFKLDEKFDSDVKTDEEEEEEVRRTEKIKTELNILSKVLGTNISSKIRNVADYQTKKSLPFSRFDPENEDHLRWLEGQSSTSKKDMNEDEVNEEVIKTDEAEPERITEGHFFEVDQEFVETLRKENNKDDKRSGTSFSFLASIGRDNPAHSSPVKEELSQENEYDVKSHKRRLDSSKAILSNSEMHDTKLPRSHFFLMENDEETQAAIRNFYRKLPLSTVRSRWNQLRDTIIKIYKGQRKLAIKNQKLMERDAAFSELHMLRRTPSSWMKGHSVKKRNDILNKVGPLEAFVSLKDEDSKMETEPSIAAKRAAEGDDNEKTIARTNKKRRRRR